MAASVAIALFGIALAYLFYVKNPALPGRFAARFAGLYRWVYNKYFVDELYDFVFVRGILKAGRVPAQGGRWLDHRGADQRDGGLPCSGRAADCGRSRPATSRSTPSRIIVGAIIVVGYLVVIPMF